uniref:Uncharacterized protein n=1 Tax=Oryza sativa subsp. japonica TaxID=39947 RepID=Q5Z9R4_ORYSJ|nr:hypothetical protein [Oryza sativa Japonica Group]
MASSGAEMFERASDFPNECGRQMRARRRVGKKRERGPVRRWAAWRWGEEAGAVAGGAERGREAAGTAGVADGAKGGAERGRGGERGGRQRAD